MLESRPQEQVSKMEYISVRKAAVLLGLPLRTTYDLIYSGKLKACKISSRLTLIRRCDIEEMVNGGSYNKSTKRTSQPITVFYTTKEIKEKYGVSESWIFKVGKEKDIPKIFRMGKTLWSKSHIDKFIIKNKPDESITEWYSVPDLMEKFNMTTSAVYTFVILAELKKEPSKKNVQDLWNIAKVKQGNSDEEVAAYEQLTKDIGDYFEITKNVKINADGGFSFDKIDAIGNFDVTNEKQGVLMVMMEKFADKSVNFLPQGKIAIGIKYTKDSMEIVEHLTDIGFLLFHVRKDEGQHLYKVNGKIAILPDEEIATDIYRNITTTKMYAVAEFEPIDLSSPSLHSSMKAYTPETRYDAQYATINELTPNNN